MPIRYIYDDYDYDSDDDDYDSDDDDYIVSDDDDNGSNIEAIVTSSTVIVTL